MKKFTKEQTKYIAEVLLKGEREIGRKEREAEIIEIINKLGHPNGNFLTKELEELKKQIKEKKEQ